MNQQPSIIKADHSVEQFDPARLIASLERAGAGPRTAERIAERISANLISGTYSKDVYSRAFALLRKEGRPIAARYALRRALFEFGPSGHPFEDFISHLFAAEGWKVETRKIIKGACVSHEVDFYASLRQPADGKEEYLAAELKYHNDPGYKTDLKVALYVKSRFDDIFQCDPVVRACPIDRGLLVTNTKFTSEAIAYAQCAGVELLGWHYPEQDNLFLRMSRLRVYPITTLTGLTPSEKRLLVNQRIVAVDMLLSNHHALDVLRLPPERSGELIGEARELLALDAHGTV